MSVCKLVYVESVCTKTSPAVLTPFFAQLHHEPLENRILRDKYDARISTLAELSIPALLSPSLGVDFFLAHRVSCAVW